MDPVTSVEALLLHPGYVVVEQSGDYAGVLTPSDVVVAPHLLIADAVRPRAVLDWDLPLEQALDHLGETRQPVAPVFRAGCFAGVLCLADVLDHYAARHREIERQAEKIDRVDGLHLLAAGVGHDFNNLLTTTLLELDFLEESLGAEAPAQEHVSGVRRGLMHARDLARQLLDLARYGDGTQTAVDLEAFVRDVVPFFLKRTDIELRLAFAPDLPPVSLDVARFTQVLANLSSNAVRAMQARGVLAISASVHDHAPAGSTGLPAGRSVLLAVRDTGPGVPPAIARRIFEPYVTSRVAGEGLGLGLAVSRAIVQRHGGDIELVDRPGEAGAEFRILLPVGASRIH